MRCRGCNYELWGLPPGDCPECGKPWRFEDFRFHREFVQFLCPHCDCAYPGEYIASLASPHEFTCTGCQSAIQLNQMCARPIEGTDGSQAMQEEFVWIERRRVGRWRAFWRVVGYSLGAPSRIGNTMTQKRNLRGALWFSFLCLISASLNLIFFFNCFIAAYFYRQPQSGAFGECSDIHHRAGCLCIFSGLGACTTIIFSCVGSDHTRANSHERTLAPHDWAHA